MALLLPSMLLKLLCVTPGYPVSAPTSPTDGELGRVLLLSGVSFSISGVILTETEAGLIGFYETCIFSYMQMVSSWMFGHMRRTGVHVLLKFLMLDVKLNHD